MNSQANVSGSLTINSPLSFAEIHLIPALKIFGQENPDIRLRLKTGVQYEDMITHGIDVSIRVGELEDAQMHARQIHTSPVVVCASPAYIEKYGEPSHPDQLSEHNCLLYENSPMGSHWQFTENGKDFSVRIRPSFIANNSHSLESAAKAGMGIVMLPRYMLSHSLNQGDLLTLLAPYQYKTQIPISIVYPHTRHVALKTRSFVDFMAKYFGEK